MRRVRRWSVLLALAALLAMAAGPAAGAAPSGAPRLLVGAVTGSSSWYDNRLGCEAGATTVTEAFGRSTLMGRVQVYMEHCPEEDVTFTGDFVITADNGDELRGTYDGGGVLSPDAEIGTWIYGTGVMRFDPATSTGRFAGATGQALMVLGLIFEGYEDPEWPGYWVWFGHLEPGS
jgi:hypothetical protein